MSKVEKVAGRSEGAQPASAAAKLPTADPADATGLMISPSPLCNACNAAMACCCSKQLAVVKMEMDGLAVKLSGYERALEECELQVSTDQTTSGLAARTPAVSSCTVP